MRIYGAIFNEIYNSIIRAIPISSTNAVFSRFEN
jgi:hypothetical protein